VSEFDPRRRVDQLPERATIRRVRPDALRKPEQVRPRLGQEGIDPDSAGALLMAMLRRGWATRQVATPGKPPRVTGYVLEPRLGAVWAMERGLRRRRRWAPSSSCVSTSPRGSAGRGMRPFLTS
jgi:hypothetical protein